MSTAADPAKPQGVADVERRRSPRLPPAVDLHALVQAGRDLHRGTVKNVSEGGMAMELATGGATATLERNATVNLRFQWGDRTFITKARVAWVKVGVDGRWDVGLQYLGAPQGQEIPTLLDMSLVRIDPVWALRVPPALAVRRQVLPFALVNGTVQVACADSEDEATMKALERYIDKPLKGHAAETESLRKALQRVYGEAGQTVTGGEADPVALCNELLYAAWIRQASDIHLDPERDDVRVRLRVDGQLEDYRRLPMELHAELLSRIKVLGGMDIAEKRAPQDGRFRHSYGPGQEVDLRIATLPTKHGERATIRLLAMNMESLTLENLGMTGRDLGHVESAIRRPHGLFLTTGPTGCGKTTTLYAALRQITSQRAVNAIAVQDPVEYDLPGVALVEVDAAQKVTFGKALRSILRNDPDVILIGEIRDSETVDIAIKAALTGHLVLATLHTNSAASAVTRLIDMGTERFLIAAVLRLVVAQRLVRRLCPYCRTDSEITPEQAAAIRRPEVAGMRIGWPKGCMYCAGRGYSGRIGLFEMVPMDDDLAKATARDLDEARLGDELRARKIPSIVDDAIDKMRNGLTSYDEVFTAVAL